MAWMNRQDGDGIYYMKWPYVIKLRQCDIVFADSIKRLLGSYRDEFRPGNNLLDYRGFREGGGTDETSI